MTKINKLGKSTFVIAILSFLLVAVLAFGGTYAYFSDKSTEVTGSVNLGHLEITDFKGTGDDGAIKFEATVAQPNQTIVNDTVTATINANIKYYIRVKFDVNVTPATDAAHLATEDAAGKGDRVADDLSILNITVGGTTWEEVDNSGYYYLKTFGAQTAATQTMSIVIKVQDWVGANGCTYYMDAEVEVTAQVEVLQAEYLEAAPTDNASLHEAWDDAVAKAQA